MPQRSNEGDDRAQWTFGRLLDWHLRRGTRPGGRIDRPGRSWTAKAFADAIGVGDRTVRYWLRNEHLPPEVETIERILFGKDPDYPEWRLELRQARADAGVERPSPNGKRLPVSNVPIRVPAHFKGRDDALAAIEAAFKGDEGGIAVAITALHGLRGVGKSTLAAAYAERCRSGYPLTWWIRAQTESTLRADLVALGIRLRWVHADDKEDPALAAVMERLRQENEGILLVFDNAIDADALKPYLPRGGAVRVLITSNAHAWRGVASPVQIRVWPRDIGADFLIARTGRMAERTQAEALSQALGGLPLAHEQVAAYCERLDISLGAYLKRFEATPAQFLNDARHAPAEYGLTVAKTFALAIDEAAKLHPAAEPLIVHAALLAPDPIPLFLFAEAHEKFDEPLRSALAGDGLDEAVAALRALALVDRETVADERDGSLTTEAIRLHRLVREVAARRADKSGDRVRDVLAGALAAVYPDDACDNPASWPRCAPLTPHLLAICGREMTDAAANAQYADLLGRAGEYFHGRAAYSAARPLFERALAIRESALGPEHPDTALNLNNLAWLLKDQGDLAGARPHCERALAIREKVLGSEHPDTAIGFNTLAALLQDQGDLAGARPLYERALAICEKVLGPEHADTAISLNNLATLVYTQGDLARARPLFESALAIREKVLGPEHSDTASSLSGLARVLSKTGYADDAEALFKRAIAIGEKALGLDRPLTQRFCSHHARLLLDIGRAAEALYVAQEALAVHEKACGPNHPWTKDSARIVADALEALNRDDEAAARRERHGIEH